MAQGCCAEWIVHAYTFQNSRRISFWSYWSYPRNPCLLQNITLKKFETGGRGGGRRAMAETCSAGVQSGVHVWTGLQREVLDSGRHCWIGFTPVSFQTEPHNVKGWEFVLVLNQSVDAAVIPSLRVLRCTEDTRIAQHVSCTFHSTGGEEMLCALWLKRRMLQPSLCCPLPQNLSRSGNDGVSCRYLHPGAECFRLCPKGWHLQTLDFHLKSYRNFREDSVMY